jgi:hypothetical protein
VITIRRAVPEDLDYYLKLQAESWGQDMAVKELAAKNRFDVCPGGILIAEEDGQPVGTTTVIRLAGYDFDHPMTWDETTGEGWCDTHRPDGSICFGVDLSVAKGQGGSAVDALMAGCMQLVIEAGTKYCILGGRMPRYARYKRHHPDIDPEEYMRKQVNGRYVDPQVNMYSKVPGLSIVSLIPEYFDDPDSLNYGVLLRWRNPFYKLPFRRLFAKVPVKGYNLWQWVDGWWSNRKTK